MYDELYDDLLAAMEPLARVRQDRRYHPEGDALFHSLQVFDLALAANEPPHVVAAALFHDIGKAEVEGPHEVAGADRLADVADERTLWLVAQHMDLLRDPRAHLGDPRREELARLRAYDDRGRAVHARVTPLERALGIALEPGFAEGWLDESHHLTES
ncbi:MAG: HD domain-containing protein [Sandaracinaceae bacterium]